MRHRLPASALLAALAWGTTAPVAWAWTIVSPTMRRGLVPRPNHRTLCMSTTPESPDEECGQEDECEIDWSQMPGMDDEATESEPATVSESASLDVEQLRALLERQFQLDSAPEDAKADMQTLEQYTSPLRASSETSTDASTDASTTADTSRVRLEMQWALREAADECDVYQPATCGGHECPSCAGRGVCPCRFCRGTGHVYYHQTASFVSCLVCRTAVGTEACRTCRGSGWVADWTDMGVRVGERRAS